MDDIAHELTVQSAATLLQDLLQTQTRVATEQAAANELERTRQAQVQYELDLKAKELAMKQLAETKRDRVIDEVLQRLIKSEARNEHYVSLLVTGDDNFGDTVNRVIANQRAERNTLLDCLRALYALLTKDKQETQETRAIIGAKMELLQQQENLDTLELQSAKYGIAKPLQTVNDINATKERIAELELKVKRLKGE